MMGITTEAISRFGAFEIRYRLKDESGEIVVTDDAPPHVPESSVRVFELALGQSLPADFREFIVIYSDAYVSAVVEDEDGSSPGVFYGLRENSGESLISKWATSRDWLPLFSIPIADDVASGGQICIDLSEPSRGEISSRFANQEPEIIADSFSKFLLSLEIDQS